MTAGRAVLFPVAGLVVWAAHFAAIYMANALACERDLDGPGVPVLVLGATVAALALLALVAVGARRVGPPVAEGGEGEPRFTRWFAAAAAALAGLAVVFQAIPAAVVPACGA